MTSVNERWQKWRHDRRAVWLVYIALAVLLAVLPFLTGAALGRGWVRILDFTLLYVMLALGLNIVVGYAGLLDLGYIAFYAVGAYMYALLASPHFDLHLPFWALLPLRDSRAFSGSCWGRPRSGCAAIIWPSSRSGSVRSFASFSTTSMRRSTLPTALRASI